MPSLLCTGKLLTPRHCLLSLQKEDRHVEDTRVVIQQLQPGIPDWDTDIA